MATPRAPLDFDSNQNEVLLNPRWPAADYQALTRLAVDVQIKKNLQGHVWIATSGSTAESVAAIKLVALSKKALLSSAAAVNKHLEATSQDIWTQVLPHFHVGGLGIEARAHLSGSRVVGALKEKRWDPEYFFETLKNEKCTLSALVPTQVYDLIQAGFQAPSSLRAVIVGGGFLEPELFKKAKHLGWPLLPSYGMTETASQIATASLNSLKHLDFPEMRTLAHAEVRKNAAGYLEVKGTSLFTCYAQNGVNGPEVWDPKHEGWFTTEDQGEVVDGALQIFGRDKDYVKIGGETTNMARLRSILEKTALNLNSTWPQWVTLIDSPSERLGTEIHLVSLLSKEDTASIENAYAQEVLPFEKVRAIHYLKEIPRSELGKILWGELRKRL